MESLMNDDHNCDQKDHYCYFKPQDKYQDESLTDPLTDPLTNLLTDHPIEPEDRNNRWFPFFGFRNKATRNSCCQYLTTFFLILFLFSPFSFLSLNDLSGIRAHCKDLPGCSVSFHGRDLDFQYRCVYTNSSSGNQFTREYKKYHDVPYNQEFVIRLILDILVSILLMVGSGGIALYFTFLWILLDETDSWLVAITTSVIPFLNIPFMIFGTIFSGINTFLLITGSIAFIGTTMTLGIPMIFVTATGVVALTIVCLLFLSFGYWLAPFYHLKDIVNLKIDSPNDSKKEKEIKDIKEAIGIGIYVSVLIGIFLLLCILILVIGITLTTKYYCQHQDGYDVKFDPGYKSGFPTCTYHNQTNKFNVVYNNIEDVPWNLYYLKHVALKLFLPLGLLYLPLDLYLIFQLIIYFRVAYRYSWFKSVLTLCKYFGIVVLGLFVCTFVIILGPILIPYIILKYICNNYYELLDDSDYENKYETIGNDFAFIFGDDEFPLETNQDKNQGDSNYSQTEVYGPVNYQ